MERRSALAVRPLLLLTTTSIATFVYLFIRHRRRSARRQSPPSLPRGAAEVPRVTTAAEVAAAVRSQGVCVVEDVFDAAQLSELQAQIAALEPRKMQNRRAHRWEHVHSPDALPFADLGRHPLVAECVRALLGPKTYLEKAGLLVSHPGAEPQRWHMDTPHLFSVGAHLPPHSLSVFVPLVDLVPANGPTEFQLGTHVKANLVLPQRHARACCPAGSMVIYDIRIMHRGGPNESDAERPVVYLTLSRIWYRDTLNP